MHNCPGAGKWSIATWTGQDATPIGDALALCSQQVDAAYRIDPDTQTWTRYFRGRPEISNLAALDDGQGVIALGAGVAAAPTAGDWPLRAAANGMLGCPQPGKWAISVWTGPSGTPTDQAVATCTGATVAAAYWIDPQTQAWKRYFDGRPEISNLTTLDWMHGIITLGGGEAPTTPTPTPTQPPASEGPELGTYSGTTSQGRPIQFDVVLEGGSRVVNAFGIDIEGTFQGGTCEVGGGSVIVSPPPSIVNSTFSYSGIDFDITGTFNSTTTASGDLDYHAPPGFQTPGCDSGLLTWTVSTQ